MIGNKDSEEAKRYKAIKKDREGLSCTSETETADKAKIVLYFVYWLSYEGRGNIASLVRYSEEADMKNFVVEKAKAHIKSIWLRLKATNQVTRLKDSQVTTAGLKRFFRGQAETTKKAVSL